MSNLITRTQAADYINAAKNLLPNGDAWNKNPGSNMSKFVEGLNQEKQRFDDAACDLLVDLFPATTTNFIDVWETAVGLPSKCVTADSSDDERRGQIVARLTMTGSISKDFYVNHARAMGFTIKVVEYGGIVPGVYRFGDDVGTMDDESQVYAVTFVSTDNPNIAFLECEFSDLVPAMCKAYFYYNPNFTE